MRLLVLGPQGQVGWELSRALRPVGEVIGLDRSHLDMSKPLTIHAILDDYHPDVVINAAAYTAVDQAEDDEALAMTVNAHAVGELAEWARHNRVLLIHYSTDYVFDGAKGEPYLETDATNPINAYGRSKLAGERALAEVNPNFLCLRTSWVYACRGSNFFLTMLRLGRERETVQVVSDQISVPNWAASLADATAQIIPKARRKISDKNFLSGILHLSGQGACSWHEFATQILERSRPHDKRLIVRDVQPILSIDLPARAKRPEFSGLASHALLKDWQVALPHWESMLTEAINERFA